MRIKLIADSAADIPKEEAERYGIEVLWFPVFFGDEQYDFSKTDGFGGFYQKLRESEVFPTTSQIPPVEVEDAYRKFLKEYDAIIHVAISSEASGAYSSASLIAQSMRENEGADITVIDSRCLSIAIGVPVINAAKMLEEGHGKEEVIEYLNTTMSRDTAYFMVDDLRHLRKGGRIRATTMMIAELLDIKPICKVNGLVEAIEKIRGTKKAIAKLVDIIEENGRNLKEQEIGIVFGDETDKADYLVKLINERIAPKSVKTYNVGPAIAVHSGPSVVGVYFSTQG